MAREAFAFADTLDNVDFEGEELPDSELDDLSGLSSDLDNWGDDAYREELDYISALFR